MKTQCPNCKSKFSVNETNIGKQAKCPKCGKPFTIEPFTETPVAVEAPAKNPEPAAPIETPVKSPEPVKPPLQTAKPVEVPAKSAEPLKEKKPKSKALSKTVFVYCWVAVRIIAGILGGVGLTLAIKKGAHSTLIATFAAADVFLVCSVVIELALFYRMWAAIQDDKVSISPPKAVGFLFIPVFDIYWALCMLTGFTEDYNSFIHRRLIKAKDLSFVLFLIYAFMFISVTMVVTTPMVCVFAFTGLISRAFIGYPIASWVLFSFALAAGIAHFITYLLVAITTCNAINALPDGQNPA